MVTGKIQILKGIAPGDRRGHSFYSVYSSIAVGGKLMGQMEVFDLQWVRWFKGLTAFWPVLYGFTSGHWYTWVLFALLIEGLWGSCIRRVSPL
jgi:hypothetical protein